ncbi:hypothetical protein Hanom_Chr06g00505821 [Helianthus anomalus]
MVLSSIPDPPGFYWLCIVVPLGGCKVGFSLELVAWWARGFVRAGWAAVGYLSANGCRVRSIRRFLCSTLKKRHNLRISSVNVKATQIIIVNPSNLV